MPNSIVKRQNENCWTSEGSSDGLPGFRYSRISTVGKGIMQPVSLGEIRSHKVSAVRTAGGVQAPAPENPLARRVLIQGGMAAALGWAMGAAFPGIARAGAAKDCVDPDLLSGADASLRSAMEYKPRSADPATRCSGCAFFTPDGGDAQCGQCAILGGPVDGGGHCASWSPRE